MLVQAKGRVASLDESHVNKLTFKSTIFFSFVPLWYEHLTNASLWTVSQIVHPGLPCDYPISIRERTFPLLNRSDIHSDLCDGASRPSSNLPLICVTWNHLPQDAGPSGLTWMIPAGPETGNSSPVFGIVIQGRFAQIQSILKPGLYLGWVWLQQEMWFISRYSIPHLSSDWNN